MQRVGMERSQEEGPVVMWAGEALFFEPGRERGKLYRLELGGCPCNPGWSPFSGMALMDLHGKSFLAQRE